MVTPQRPPLARLARPSGALAMVAIDQRESLRTMFTQALGEPALEPLVVDFKLAVAQALAPVASAMLFDRRYGTPAFEAAGTFPSCARIVAADDLTQPLGGPVEDSNIDFSVEPDEMRARGAVALKLLVIWRGNENAARCIDLATRFMARCRDAGLLGIVEAIVQPPLAPRGTFDRELAIVDAARRLAAATPDLYKCQVPFGGRAKNDAMTQVFEQISNVVSCPWVVLSQGVDIDDYPRAVELACRAGASGFLAGRGIWADTVGRGDYRAQLEAVSAPRLRRLAELVDTVARPVPGTDIPA
jgi:sulfofructosephosphate aldolase